MSDHWVAYNLNVYLRGTSWKYDSHAIVSFHTPIYDGIVYLAVLSRQRYTNIDNLNIAIFFLNQKLVSQITSVHD